MNNNHSNNEFFGKSILITGASSGLGLALATFFLNSGANVIITGRDIESLNTLYNTFPKNTTVIHCNLCIDRDIVNLRNKVIEKFGSLDILITCAGMKYSGDIEKTFPDEFDEMVDINLRSVFILTKLFNETNLKVNSICETYFNNYKIKGSEFNINFKLNNDENQSILPRLSSPRYPHKNPPYRLLRRYKPLPLNFQH